MCQCNGALPAALPSCELCASGTGSDFLIHPSLYGLQCFSGWKASVVQVQSLVEEEAWSLHILGTPDFINDFTIFFIYMNSYLNIDWIDRSWNVANEFMIMKSYMNSDMNSWSCKKIVKIGEIISKFAYKTSSKNSGTWIHTWLRSIYTYEVVYHVSYTWIHSWIHIMNSFMNSLIWRIFWIIHTDMKSWLNSLILIGSGFSFKSISVKEQILLNQSNKGPYFAVSSLPAAAAAWWQRAVLLLQHTSGVAAQSRGDLKGLMDDVRRHWRRDLHGPNTFGTFPLRLYSHWHHNHAHVPGPHMWLSASPWPYPKCSKQWKSGCSC